MKKQKAKISRQIIQDSWQLDQAFAIFMIPRLRIHIEAQSGYPSRLNMQTWNLLLNEMLEGFIIIRDQSYRVTFGALEPEQIERAIANRIKADRAMTLFAQYYSHLWI